MSTIISFKDNKLSQDYLSREDIQRFCPLAFAETPTNNVSEKYVLANTATVIDDMEKLGWKVVQARQRHGRPNSSGRFSYHMVAFQNPDIKIVTEVDGEEVIESYPRIILTNSHDGLNCFRFMAGLFRLVCSNGLVIATDQMVDMKIRHINYTFEELRGVVAKAVEELPSQVEIINWMKKTELDRNGQLELATSMLNIRKGYKNKLEEAPKPHLQVIEELLTPVRDEDKGDNLWEVFNRVQERLMNGNYSDENGKGGFKRARPVNSFVRDLDINAAFFQEATKRLPVAA